MTSRLSWKSHNDFSKGMSQDQPSYLLPEGFVYEARNVFVTKTGQLKKRYGNSRHTTATSGEVITSLGAVRNANNTLRGYVAHTVANTVRMSSFECQDGQVLLIPGTFIDTFVRGIAGTPVSWGGHCIFPIVTTSAVATGTQSPFVAAGGGQLPTSNIAPTNLGVVTIVANNDTVNWATPQTVVVGDYIYANNAAADYVGRIKEVLSTTSARVDPTPTLAMISTAGTTRSNGLVFGTRLESGTVEAPLAAGCISVHQDRIILGNVQTTSLRTTGKANRIYWSTLLNAPQDSPVAGSDGLVPFLKAGYLRRNYATFANMNTVIATVSIGPNTLIVLGDTGISIVSGTLGTITTDTTTANYSVRVLSSSIGCIAANSVQLTPNGVIFAAFDGIYLTDGNTFTNITENKIKRLWRNGMNGGATIGGSAIIEGKIYALSTSIFSDDLGGTFFCDLSNNYAWTRTNAPNAESLPFSMSVNDPDPLSSRVYVIGEYTDTTICKNPQLLRMDPIYPNDYTGFTLDVSFLDGTDVLTGLSAGGIIDTNDQRVTARIQTRAYTEGDPALMRRFRHTQLLTSIQDETLANSYLTASYVLGTNPDNTWTLGNRYTFGDDNLGVVARPIALANQNQAFTKRFDTNMNSQAITIVLTDGDVGTVGTPSWTLFEVVTATNQLRMGRLGDGITPDATSINTSAMSIIP